MTASPSAQDVAAEKALISEIFHDLSQPVTALQCLLELSLRRDKSIADLRTTIEKALENADRLRRRLVLIRALNAAGDPGDLRQTADLNQMLRDLHADMLPLFVSGERELSLKLCRRPAMIRGEGSRLRQALFCFLEWLFRYSLPNSSTRVSITVTAEQQAEICIEAHASLSASAHETGPGLCPFEVEMARRTFGAFGGEFLEASTKHGRAIWKGLLPLA